jgi:hypothetical protein
VLGLYVEGTCLRPDARVPARLTTAMGNSHSAIAALGSRDELLGRLAGPEPLHSSEAFWSQLLNIQVPLASLNPVDVEEAIVPHCRQLCKPHLIFQAA